jgi:hypothetical protein
MTRYILLALIMLPACSRVAPPASAQYRPLIEVEAVYGRFITAGNHPTPDQNGTGERVGGFQDVEGTVWVLPLAVADDGSMLACAPVQLHTAKTTGVFPAESAIIGATNQPTGWRGGTGALELVLRDENGPVRRYPVQGAAFGQPGCWTPASKSPHRDLYYYRLAPRISK